MEHYMDQVFIQISIKDNLDVLLAAKEMGESSIQTVTASFQYREKLGSLRTTWLLYDQI